MTTDKLAFIDQDIANLKEQGLFLTFRTVQSAQGPWLTVDGKRVLNFCSNNYLGLADHPRVKEAAKKAIDEFGVGPTSARQISGTLALHVELEKRLAAFKGVEDAIYVQSGFCANQAVIPALVGKEMSSSPTGSTMARSSMAAACRAPRSWCTSTATPPMPSA